jgi:nicotinamide-nucleotide amidase
MVRLRYRPRVDPRPLTNATLLAIGSELTTGATRDTNSGDLAHALAGLGVAVRSLQALPDDLERVRAAIVDAIASSDLVMVTGGLGPTPDDLTREAVAAALAEVPVVDPRLAAELRAMFERRALPMPDANLKQAWLIPSATALPNPFGTAPGWWVDRSDGGVVVALPGPPREMLPMWRELVLPRLRARGLGRDQAVSTWRLTGIGESALVVVIGEDRLRAANPTVATYARSDAVDVRITALAEGDRTAGEVLAAAEAALAPALAPYAFARGEETWIDAIGARLAGRSLAVVEVGTGGQVGTLLGAARWFAVGELVAPDTPIASTHADLAASATRARDVAGVACGLAVRARERGGDMAVTVATDIEGRVHRVTRTAFLAGDVGRRRAAITAAAELWMRLGSVGRSEVS